MLASLQIFYLASHEYASALAFVLRLGDVRPCLAFLFGLIVGPELSVLHGQHPSEREEVILIEELTPEGHQIQAKQILASKYVHSWVMVDLLEEMHLDEDIRIDGEVSPIDVPISRIVTLLHLPFERFCNLCHDWVLSHYVSEDVT